MKYILMSRDLNKPVYLDQRGLLTRDRKEAATYPTYRRLLIAYKRTMAEQPGGVEHWIGQVASYNCMTKQEN